MENEDSDIWALIKSTIYDHFVIFASTVGILSLALGLFFKTTHPNIATISISAGSAILASGVFSAITKSFLFKELFENHLTKIIYGKEYLKSRPELADIWENVTECFLQKHDPEFSESLSRIIRDQYLTFNEDNAYFRKNFIHTIFVEWADEQENIIRVSDSLSYDAYLLAKTATLKATCRFHVKNCTHYEKAEFKINDELIDVTMPDSNILELQTFYEKKITDEGKPYKFSSNVVRTFDLDEDPTFKLFCGYVFKPDVTIESKNENLIFMFESSGTKERFTDVDLSNSDKPKNIYRRLKYHDMLLDGHGYIITFLNKSKFSSEK